MIRLTSLTYKQIEDMHDTMIRAGRSARTVRLSHAPLRGALQDAVRDGVIPNNPAVLVRLPPLQKVNIDPFTAQEAQDFLDHNRGYKLYHLYHLALSTGLRMGEILALRVGRDIDTIHQIITVRETRRYDVTGPPKSRESARKVMLSTVAMNVLVEAIAKTSWGEWAFPFTNNYVSLSMTKACKRAGVKRIRFHDLRHTHATLLLASGANIQAVSARLCHSSSAFTLAVYGHVLPGMDEELAKTIGDIVDLGHYQNSITAVG